MLPPVSQHSTNAFSLHIYHLLSNLSVRHILRSAKSFIVSRLGARTDAQGVDGSSTDRSQLIDKLGPVTAKV